jgi:hypothetical protein
MEIIFERRMNMVEKVRVTVIDFDKERRKQEFKEKLNAKIRMGRTGLLEIRIM